MIWYLAYSWIDMSFPSILPNGSTNHQCTTVPLGIDSLSQTARKMLHSVTFPASWFNQWFKSSWTVDQFWCVNPILSECLTFYSCLVLQRIPGKGALVNLKSSSKLNFHSGWKLHSSVKVKWQRSTYAKGGTVLAQTISAQHVTNFRFLTSQNIFHEQRSRSQNFADHFWATP